MRAYPGHHTERTAKDAQLYQTLGRVETSVAITPSPESVLTEGLAMIALEEALGSRPFGVVADILSVSLITARPTAPLCDRNPTEPASGQEVLGLEPKRLTRV